MVTFDNWDATEYIHDLCERSKYAKKNEFYFGLGSGWDGLTDVISSMRTQRAFLIVDETAESNIAKVGAGYFETKVYTVFLLRRCAKMDEKKRLEQLNICRTLMRKILSKMIVDAEELKSALIYLDTDVQVREIGEVVLNGLTGLYFTFSFGRPQDLSLEEDEWEDPYKTYGM